jgi:phage virion morphogenesis protein
VRIDIDVRNDSGVKRRLRQLANADPEQAMPVIGETLVDLTKATFRAERSPYGQPWKPLSPATMAMRRQGSSSRILQNTRRLYNSISAQPVNDGISVGTNVVYARAQQFGNPDNRFYGGARAPIPARPFLPWKPGASKPELPTDWMDEVISVLSALYGFE